MDDFKSLFYSLVIFAFLLFTENGIAQVSKTNSTQGTVFSATANHISRTFTYAGGDFGGCSSLTEVEIAITLAMGNDAAAPCNTGSGGYAVQEDLNLRLVSPSGTTVDLIQDKWGYWTGVNPQPNTFSSFATVFAEVTFDDDAATVASGGWTAGTFKPVNALSAFDGENPAGIWTLHISDGDDQFSASDYFCFSTATLTVTCGPAASTWDGSTSTDWNVASNWSTNSVPTSSDDVVIPSAPSNQPHVTLGPGTPAQCAALTVESGATLTVDAGKSLTVSGDTDNDGTIIVKASASGIGSFIDNGTITGSGSFQMEQYLTGSGGGTPNGLFWYVSSPVASATSNVYNAAGTDKLWSAAESTQSYPEITNNSTSLNVGQGYIARLGATGTKTFTGGAFNTGNITEGGLTRTGTTELNRGYNLVGNPYPSTVDWDDLGRTNLETTMWYRTHNGSTMLFDTYNATGMVGTNNNGGGTVDGTIPPTQGFWVRVSADGLTGSVSFDNADRSHGTLSSIYRMAQEEGTVRLNLSDGNVWDEQVIYFDPNATDQLDDYDSRKFWADGVPQLYSNLQEDTLTINGLYSPQTTQMVPLGMKLPAQGDYTLNASSITLTETPVYLEDTYLNVFQNLEITTVYPFTSDAGNIGDRFILHFSELTGVDERNNEIGIYSFGNQIQVNLNSNKAGTITVFDLSGRTILTQNLNSDRTTVELNASKGIYLVQVETSSHTLTRKVNLQ